MFHKRSTHKKYVSYPKPDSCPFCDPNEMSEVVRTTEYAFIKPNRTFYDLWELRKVADHLLVVPKRHVHSLADLSEVEQLDVMKLLGEYESKGYNVYARAASSKQRSIAHQHTHLIKTYDHQAPHGSLFLKKPYFLIKF